MEANSDWLRRLGDLSEKPPAGSLGGWLGGLSFSWEGPERCLWEEALEGLTGP